MHFVALGIVVGDAPEVTRKRRYAPLGSLPFLKQDLAEGRIRPEQLNKISIEHAVRRAHEYDQERKKAMAETALKATEGMPVHKDYGNGFKWIELTMPKLAGLPEGHTLVQSPNTKNWAVKDSNGKFIDTDDGNRVLVTILIFISNRCAEEHLITLGLTRGIDNLSDFQALQQKAHAKSRASGI